MATLIGHLISQVSYNTPHSYFLIFHFKVVKKGHISHARERGNYLRGDIEILFFLKKKFDFILNIPLKKFFYTRYKWEKLVMS